jgi:hypothetical protein
MPRPLPVKTASRSSTSSFGRPSSTLGLRLALAVGIVSCGLHCGGAGASVRPGTNQLAVAVDDDDASTPERWVPLLPYLGRGQIAPNTWYRIVIPMSALNPTNLPIRRVLIGNRSTSRDLAFFVDYAQKRDSELVCVLH